MTDKEKLYQAYYQPHRLWTGNKATKELHKIASMSKKDYVYPWNIRLRKRGRFKFSLSDIWNLFQEDLSPNNKFYRQMINCMKAWDYLQKTSDLPLNTKTIKQVHKIMMNGEDILMGEYRKSPVFAG